ncbi:hypothetical protein IF125_10560 [Empedobacter stercoris]|uniref:hypothetical protein n=1 Tax=Empedobacter stercoris TaxID=1628248 RepID=UPI001CE22591|nr:hypothetical protein [Empedobacter stercoris]MCA4782693.1 hypothetical protein [Empedobacter stercoris]
MEKSLLEKYEGSNTLRALVNLIPTIGGSLDILLSIKGSKWREDRLKEFLSHLDSRISEIESLDLINKISESEEFYDLIVQSMNSVIKTRHREKIICYTNILICNLTNQESKISSDLYVSILDSITIDEIKYLSALKDSNFQITFEKINGENVIWEMYKQHLEKTNINKIPENCLLKFDNELIWKILSDKNLILIESKKDFKYLPYTYSTSMSSLSSTITSSSSTTYKISEFGKDFINWILN